MIEDAGPGGEIFHQPGSGTDADFFYFIPPLLLCSFKRPEDKLSLDALVAGGGRSASASSCLSPGRVGLALAATLPVRRPSPRPAATPSPPPQPLASGLF